MSLKLFETIFLHEICSYCYIIPTAKATALVKYIFMVYIKMSFAVEINGRAEVSTKSHFYDI